MPHRVTILPLAEQDAERIRAWLAQRSPAGARTWYESFQRAVFDLSTTAGTCAIAEESRAIGREFRERLFKTRRGSTYRVLFMIRGDEVCVL